MAERFDTSFKNKECGLLLWFRFLLSEVLYSLQATLQTVLRPS